MANAKTNSPIPGSNSRSNFQNPIESIVSLNIPISTKLSQNKFPYMEITDPPNYQRAENGENQSSPDFLPWHHQDQLLLGWMRSSLTELIQAQVVSCTTTAELWTTLTQIFFASSRARLTDLHRQLQTASKGPSSCSEYLQWMCHLADKLAFIGSPLFDDDPVMSVLNGLGPDFNPFVAAVTTASYHAPLTFADIHGLLLSHESLLQGQSSTFSLPSMASPAAFVARYNFSGIKSAPSISQPTYPFSFPKPNPLPYNPLQQRPLSFRPGPRQPNVNVRIQAICY